MDKVTPAIRSRMMSRVRGRDTAPELRVRRALHAAGFRFRLHRRDLPGRPDIVLPALRTAVFVHGCFWHGHDCPRGRRPTSNAAFWIAKLDRNLERDRDSVAALDRSGWTVRTVWECQVENDTSELLAELQGLRDQRRSDRTR
ncbi:MAG: very short patch repair endonuclease [Sphingomicrobium sp.]